MSIDVELKRIAKEEAQLAKQKKALVEQQKAAKAAGAKLDTLCKQSGYASPRELVEALIEKYGLRISRKRASGPAGRRKRTKITPQLRDTVKTRLKKESMNRVSKDLEISYAVIAKIAKGHYDKLK